MAAYKCLAKLRPSSLSQQRSQKEGVLPISCHTLGEREGGFSRVDILLISIRTLCLLCPHCDWGQPLCVFILLSRSVSFQDEPGPQCTCEHSSFILIRDSSSHILLAKEHSKLFFFPTALLSVYFVVTPFICALLWTVSSMLFWFAASRAPCEKLMSKGLSLGSSASLPPNTGSRDSLPALNTKILYPSE